MRLFDIFRKNKKELFYSHQDELNRFVDAHELSYVDALNEIRAGHKQSHWMWYIFPQLRGLGRSRNADYYGIANQKEAEMFLVHPVLGKHLREITEAVTAIDGRSAEEIFGGIDSIKFRSSMTLFDCVCPNDIFRKALQKFYGDKPDHRTLEMVNPNDHIVKGGIIGAIIGDVVGSRYEWCNCRSTDFELFTSASRFTDDTVMTIAVADWLLSGVPLQTVMTDWGKVFPAAGYGGMFYRWLFKSENKTPYNSFGNGSGMRVSPCGYFAKTLDEALDLAKQSAEVSHNHPEGIKGAQAIAVAIFMARKKAKKEEIRAYIEQTFDYNLHRTCDEIRPIYEFNETCQGSCPEAIIAFLDSSDYESAIRLAVSIGGDSDTIACMTGGIAAAYYGIPAWIVQRVMNDLPKNMQQIIKQFDELCIEKDI